MSKIETTIVADEVYRRIKLLIIEGKITPGTRIDRRKLASELGVSMTPVNEAAARLVGERFLERRSGSSRESDGLFVPDRPMAELIHIFALRAALEGIAAWLCVERAKREGDENGLQAICDCFSAYSDDSPPVEQEEVHAYLAEDLMFHESMIAYAGNPVLLDIDSNLGWMHRSYIRGLIRTPTETLPEHRGIIEALRAKDADKAQRLIMLHHLRTREFLKNKVENEA